jgi:hypothetical protein
LCGIWYCWRGGDVLLCSRTVCVLQDFLKAKDSLHLDTVVYHTRCVCEVFYYFKCCLWGVLLERWCSCVSYQIKMFKNQTFFKVKYL